MGHIFKLVLSIMIIPFYISIFYLAFSSSLNNDGYIHLLKDSFVDDISGLNEQFVGFKRKFDSDEREITSKYENYPVVYFLLEYQNYVCDDDNACRWETYKTESDSTPFTVTVNNGQIEIKQIEDA